jgi:Zn-finger nucleic acid-binding protein
MDNNCGGMQMSNCPICETPMKKEQREIQKGIFAQVEVCPKYEDEWIDEKEFDAIWEKVRQGHDWKERFGTDADSVMKELRSL